MATPTLDAAEKEIRARFEAGLMEATGGAILALVAHVRALEEKLMLERAAMDETNERIGIEELGRRQEIDINGERITALDAKVAALGQDDGSDTYAGQLRRLLLSANGENHRLRAENAELRKRIASLETVRKMEQLIPPKWPAPQPIETAPLGRILVVFEGGQMEVIRPVKVDTESSWREFLKMNKATHWWPVPPPPGGGK